MAKEPLSSNLAKDGEVLLKALDSLGFGVQTALWAYDYQLEDWRLYIGSELVASLGRTQAYKLLMDVFGTVEFSDEFSLVDVHLTDLEAPAYFVVASTGNYIGFAHASMTECVIEGIIVDVYIYRVFDDRTGYKKTVSANAFQKNVKNSVKVSS